MKNHIGLKIKELMKHKNISVKEVAELKNVTEQAIYGVFRKESIKLNEVDAWASLLNVNRLELLAGDTNDFVEKINQNVLPDEYMMKYIAELEERISEQSEQLRKKDEQISVLLGKSKGIFTGRFANQSPIFFGRMKQNWRYSTYVSGK